MSVPNRLLPNWPNKQPPNMDPHNRQLKRSSSSTLLVFILGKTVEVSLVVAPVHLVQEEEQTLDVVEVAATPPKIRVGTMEVRALMGNSHREVSLTDLFNKV